jgi:glycosidase
MYGFIFTFCGSPVLVYGDEIGMTECAPLNWGSFNWNTEQWNVEIWRTVRNLIKVRKENPEIQNRHFFTLYIDDIKRVYAYDRGGLIVVLNCGMSQSFVELPAWDGTYTDLASGAKYTAFSQKLKLSVDPLSYRILKREV